MNLLSAFARALGLKGRWMLALVGIPLFVAGVAYAANVYEDSAIKWFSGGIYVGPRAMNPPGNSDNKLTRTWGEVATIDFASTTVGTVDSSAITVTGAKVGDPCSVGTPATGGAANAAFTCYVSAANAAKVRFTPNAGNVGSITLTSASPSTGTATVLAGSVCMCTNETTQANPVKCAVSSTTLTATGPNTVTDVINYVCRSPVDPASASFEVRGFSRQ